MIDLHTHSALSDGTDPPERIPELAAAAGCSAVALTDHDTMSGVRAARRRAEELDIELVGGCEVSCALNDKSAHILVYFAEDEDSPLQSELARLRDDRVRRNKRLANNLASLGLPVTYGEALERAAGEESLGRPHFAAVLVDKGVAKSVDEVFERWIGHGRPAYVSKARVHPSVVFEAAARSGAVGVLAHPLSLGLEWPELTATVSELAQAGMIGLEATYGRYSPEQRGELLDLARRFDLVATGGSDYHGTMKPDLSVGIGQGDLKVNDEVLEQLKARRPR